MLNRILRKSKIFTYKLCKQLKISSGYKEEYMNIPMVYLFGLPIITYMSLIYFNCLNKPKLNKFSSNEYESFYLLPM
jgi:hypothetical protein